MAKTYMSHTKYVIHQHFKIKGVVEKHDIIGAIFGQSEGLTGEDLSLKELQSSGKIGRIEINLEQSNGITSGTLEIPSSADMVETTILAATIESVDKVGPCDAEFVTERIEDTRSLKRKHIIARAKELLSQLIKDQIPDSQEITRAVEEEVRASEITSYGKDKLPAGPNIDDVDEIILVEGRADVINLLKYNIKNVVAFGGSNITDTVVDLCNKKITTVFIDGDRGGELNLKKLMQLANIDYIARAPKGKEVEELTKKEILMCLKKRVPVVVESPLEKTEDSKDTVFENKEKKIEEKKSIKKRDIDFLEELKKIKGKLKARLYKDRKLVSEIPVRELLKYLKEKKDIDTIVFDGIITKRLLELSKSRGVKEIIAIKIGKMSKAKGIKISTLE